MEAYDGYFENGNFHPAGQSIHIPGRRRAIITILDEPGHNDTTAERLAAIDEFFSAIDSSNEDAPDFERLQITKE